MSSIHAADWEELPPLPEPNGGGLCGAVQGRIVIAGGTNWEGGAKNWLRSSYDYNPARRTWTKRPDIAGGPLAYAVPFQKPGAFGFIGGTDGTRGIRAIGTVDGTGVKLVEIPELPAAVVLSAGGAVGAKYILVGGTDDAANIAGVQRSTHIAELIDGRWSVTRGADYPGKPFAVAASATLGGELFVFGGANWDATGGTAVNATEAHAFSPDRNAWRPLRPLQHPNRGIGAIAIDDRHLYLAGGFTDAFTDEAFLYDTKTDTHRAAKPLPMAAMTPLVLSEGFVYCLGGEDKMKSRTARCFRIPVAELLK